VTATGGKTFTYDSQNELVSMNGGAVSLVYDGDGNRVAETGSAVTTKYLVDDLNPTGYAQVVEETVNGAPQREYAYGLQQIDEDQIVNNSWTVSYYGYDGFGTVRQLTNAAGAVTDTYDYDALGNLLNSTGTTPNAYMYRGEAYDSDLGLYYLRARYYNPQTGRFMSRDPNAGQITTPATLHRYLYADGDRADLFDPTGRDAETETGLTFALLDTRPLPALTELAGGAYASAASWAVSRYLAAAEAAQSAQAAVTDFIEAVDWVQITNKIGASTPYDFQAHNLTACGGLLPVATMLEKLGFQQLIEENLTIKRQTRAMPVFRFILGMILACYVGFSRLHHLRFLKREPMLTGILHVAELPPQCTFWRFLASLHPGIARQLPAVEKRMWERVWAAANIELDTITVDTDTTVHTLFGKQMGARKGYNPKNKGKKSYQPILSFIAERREYAAGALRNGDRPDGREIAAHLNAVAGSLPPVVKHVHARADSGFYCREAIDAYEKKGWHYIVVARKTARLIDRLQTADWKPSPKTDADEQCEFLYQPEGWARAHRFLALRYARTEEDEDPEQYQLFDTPGYIYRFSRPTWTTLWICWSGSTTSAPAPRTSLKKPTTTPVWRPIPPTAGG
jgi:RHS repeat-associated protein